MSLEAALQENTAVMRELIARLTAVPGAPLVATPEGDKGPKPDAKTAGTSRTAEAVNKPAADALAKKDAATAQELTGDAAPAGGDTTTYEDVKRAILEVSKAKGRDAAIKVLAQFGATKGPDLQSKPETFGPFVAAAKAVIGS